MKHTAIFGFAYVQADNKQCVTSQITELAVFCPEEVMAYSSSTTAGIAPSLPGAGL